MSVKLWWLRPVESSNLSISPSSQPFSFLTRSTTASSFTSRQSIRVAKTSKKNFIKFNLDNEFPHLFVDIILQPYNDDVSISAFPRCSLVQHHPNSDVFIYEGKQDIMMAWNRRMRCENKFHHSPMFTFCCCWLCS